MTFDVGDAGAGEAAAEGFRVEETERGSVSTWLDGSAGEGVADGEVGGDVDVLCAWTGGKLLRGSDVRTQTGRSIPTS